MKKRALRNKYLTTVILLAIISAIILIAIKDEKITGDAIRDVSLDSLVYEEYFHDGDYITSEGEKGLTWSLLNGSAFVKNGWLSVSEEGSLIIANQEMPNEYTMELNVNEVWSHPAGIIFLYGDEQNYYEFNTNSVYRTLNGKREKLTPDYYSSALGLPHSGGSQAKYKIYVKKTDNQIEIKIDKDGYSNGGDFILSFIDYNPESVSKFSTRKIGLKDNGDSGPGGNSFSIDDIRVYSGMKESIRPWPKKDFYVSLSGSDSNPGTFSQPFRTVQKAADIALPGDTIIVGPGVYREGGIVINNTGTKDNPLIFKAQDLNDKPILEGAIKFPIENWSLYGDGIYQTEISWNPTALYHNEIPLFPAQEPDQLDPQDSLQLQYFRDVPYEENNNPNVDPKQELVDSSFFTQQEEDFWVNATLLLYNAYSNAIAQHKIFDYIPSENKIIFERDQWRSLMPGDKYAIRNHLSILDKPGEWVIETSEDSSTLYVRPYDGQDIEDVEISFYETSFSFPGVFNEYIIIDGFEIRKYRGNGLSFSTRQGSVRHSEVRNSEIHHNFGSGVGISYNSDFVSVINNTIYGNYWNGVSLGGRGEHDIIVKGNNITQNLDNGIWVGGGYSGFSVWNVLIRDNVIYHQGSKRRHPDNIQIHQVYNITIDGNTVFQEGHQNTWFQYSDLVTVSNNIFRNGVVGINSMNNSYIYNNVFDGATLRYDAHLFDYRNGDPKQFAPKRAEIKNNVIIKSNIALPPEDYWNNFHVENNLFSNSEGNWKSVFDYGKNHLVHAGEDYSGYFTNYPENLKSPQDGLLIDKGARAPFWVERDKEGNIRYQGASADIGPYEYPNQYSYNYCTDNLQNQNEDGVDCGGICIQDFDNDKYSSGYCGQNKELDCNDENPEINPGAEEICDGIDNNCDGRLHPVSRQDPDRDGLNSCIDNCPRTANPSQEDFDNDRIGDACDFLITYEDDFDDRSNGREDLGTRKMKNGLTWESINGSFDVILRSGGKHVGTGWNEDGLNLLATKEGRDSWMNYSISLEIAKSWSPDYAGVVLNYQDPSNFYYFNIRGGSLKKMIGGKISTISNEESVGVTHRENNYNNYTLNVTHNGSLVVEVSKNGGSVVNLIEENPEIVRGSIGLIGGSSVSADTFKVVVSAGSECTDRDSDGFNQPFPGCGIADCDDTNARINPNSAEIPNGVDDNCNGKIDEIKECRVGQFLVNLTGFDGETIDLCRTGRLNINKLILEKKSLGKIIWNKNFNFAGNINFPRAVEIEKNRISVNPSQIPDLNSSSELSLYELDLVNPIILKDGEVCPEDICNIVNYSNGTLIFNVTHFTNYTASDCGNGICDNTESYLTCSLDCSAPPDSNSGSSGGSGGGRSSSSASNSLNDISLENSNSLNFDGSTKESEELENEKTLLNQDSPDLEHPSPQFELNSKTLYIIGGIAIIIFLIIIVLMGVIKDRDNIRRAEKIKIIGQ